MTEIPWSAAASLAIGVPFLFGFLVLLIVMIAGGGDQ